MPIEKTLIAPKTWELKNVEPEPYLNLTPAEAAAQEAQAENQARMFEEMQQLQSGKIKQENIPFDQGPQNVQDYMRMAKEAPGKQKKEWRRQFRDFYSEIGDPRSDPVQGIQSLLDSGAIWITDEGDVWSGVPGHQGRRGKEQNQRLLDAASQWQDWYKDQMAYGEDIGRAGQPLADAEMQAHLARIPQP